MKIRNYFVMAFALSSLTLTANLASAVCADSIEVKLNSFTVPTGKGEWGSTPEFLSLVKSVNGVTLKNSGEDERSGCMYESTDAAKSVFADFGKGELIVYPSDMYLQTIDVSKGSFQPSIIRFYFDFNIDATPDLAVSEAKVGMREIIESCSDAADTCRADAAMQTYWDTTSYSIALHYGARKIVLKK